MLVMKTSREFLYRLFVLTCLLLLPTALFADDKRNDERDVWRGCSLGIRLDLENQIPVVEKIYEHVADSSPFLADDKIIELEDLEFPGATLNQIGELLDQALPGQELKAIVRRNETDLSLTVVTFRKELVDIQAIYRRLKKNRIISDHLAASDRDDLVDGFTSRMVDGVRKSKSPREAAEVLNRIIDEIGISHTAIIPASAGLSFSSTTKGSLGLVLQRQSFNGRSSYFVIDQKPGTVSYNSALKIGDQILTINGIEIEQSRRLDLSGHEDRHQLFSIQADMGEEIAIEFVHSPFEDVQLSVFETGKDPSTVESARASAKTIMFDSNEIGYMRFWNLMSLGIGTEFSKHVKNRFAECDAIIMDLRGRGGMVPAVVTLNRTVKKLEKPVVVVIDGLTRSAKEMLAYLLKKQDHVLVVGVKTTGAVTGATIVKLPSGNSLMVPVASADSLKRFVDGTIIEGLGVEPDEVVKHFVPYSNGNDRMLNFAIRRATELAKLRNDVTGR